MKQQPELITSKKTEIKKPNYGLRRGVALGSVVLTLLGAYEGGKAAIEHFTHQTYVGSETFSVANGSTIIEEAQAAAADLAVQYGINPSDIPNDQIVYESQAAGTEFKEKSHTTDIHPGDSFTETLTESVTGYNIAIDPIGITPTK